MKGRARYNWLIGCGGGRDWLTITGLVGEGRACYNWASEGGEGSL